MKQTEAVKDYMERFGSISSFEAFKDLGITRLSGRIYDLRREGVPITAEKVKYISRLGREGTYARYRIKGGSDGYNS